MLMFLSSLWRWSCTYIKYQEAMSVYADQIKIANLAPVHRVITLSWTAGSSGRLLRQKTPQRIGTVRRLRAARSVDAAAADCPSEERWLTDDSGPGPLPDRLMDFRCRTSGDRLSPTSDRLSPSSDRLSPSSDRLSPTGDRLSPSSDLLLPSSDAAYRTLLNTSRQ